MDIMDIQERLEYRMLEICQKMTKSSDRVELVHQEASESKNSDLESGHFLKVDGRRVGADIEVISFMAIVPGVEIALAEFAQLIATIKALGCWEEYDAVRHDCSELADLIDAKFQSAWSDIFSIPGRPTETDA